MEIPKQLEEIGFKFVLLGKWDSWKNVKTNKESDFSPDGYKTLVEEKEWKPLGKTPFESSWQTKGYDFNSIKLKEHIKEKNIGIIGGYGRLRILDIDDKKLGEALEETMNTFTIKTGSGGKHFYFLSDYKENKVLINDLGELRANNYQVVTIPSRHPNGNYYELHKDIPIREISEEEILKILKPYLRETIQTTTLKQYEGKDTSRSGLEFRKILALLRKGKSRKKIYEEMIAYSKWSNSPEQYKTTTFEKAEDFYLKEQEKEGREEIVIKEPTKEKIDETKIILGETFERIKEVLQKYIKLKEEYYDLVAVWIIGTYCMKSFETYPYLFINAQKASGKTRLLKLIEALSNKGELLASMREAVLFRIATDDKTILIDELEGLDRKENAPLRELLNACYKRGTKVYRMKKKGENYVAEAFYPFTPIAIANISGTDEVLGDRCITIHLDKSSKSTYSLRQEDFQDSLHIKQIKDNFKHILVSLCSLCSLKYTKKSWNSYIDIRYTTYTYNTLNTLNTPNPSQNDTLEDSVVSVYNKIVDSGINGRHLELIFPLLIISLMINEDLFNKILKFSKEITEKKKEDDVVESNDVSLIEFISKMSSEVEYDRFRFVHDICSKFRYFLGIRSDKEQENINPLWLGRALKRLELVIESRRLSSGREVRLNITKAVKLLEQSK